MEQNEAKSGSGIPLGRIIFYIVLIGIVAGLYFVPDLRKPPEGPLSKTIPQEKIPVVLEFTMQSCPACEAMRPEVLRLSHEFENKVVFVEASDSYEYGAALVEKFKVEVVPTFFLLDGARNVVAKYEGMVPTDELRTKIKSMIE